MDYEPGTAVVDVKAVSCFGKFSCSLDGYTRIPKDLFIGSGAGEARYLFVKTETLQKLKPKKSTTAQKQLPDAVLDVYVGHGLEDRPPTVTADGEVKWERVEGTNLFLRKGQLASADEYVGALTVLFGADAVDPRPGWFLSDATLLVDATSQLLARVTARKMPVDSSSHDTSSPQPATLPVRADGTFKIMQLADLHFSTGPGECRDPFPADAYGDHGCSAADSATLEFVERALDAEKPDLVVLTGDQAYGGSAPDQETAFLKAVAPLIRRKIPYAAILGNHDHQGTFSRAQLMELLQTLPYSLATRGPAALAGEGNYVVEIHPYPSPTAPRTSLNLFFLDSHGGNGGGFWSFLRKGEEWVRTNQIEYVVSESERLSQIQPDSIAMLFQHIPLPEFAEAAASDAARVGTQLEPVYAPEHNSGALDGYKLAGVSVVAVGHDHLNDFCQLEQRHGVWLCYGGATGEGGYGGQDFVRRIRVYDIDTVSKTIKSYKMLRDGAIIDRQTLVSHGEPVPSV